LLGGIVLAAGCGMPVEPQRIDSALSRGDCTLTVGYWKTHPESWPVASLTLGSVSYTKAQLLSILSTSVNGNGLIALAHQTIAAKLNVANGADPAAAASSIAAADALIGALVVPPVGNGYLKPSATSALTAALDAYNTGTVGPGHCGDQPPPPVCGNGKLETGEACDDGNLTNGDGCSSTCTVEPPPVCGDGKVDAGEECDDGNLANDDGCSCICTVEPPPPVCGNGKLEQGEACDDGNLDNNDGCSCTCTIEPPPVCGNGVVERGEQCDDGNLDNFDGCTCDCTKPL
jgi:cysteine-rich repeat protein